MTLDPTPYPRAARLTADFGHSPRYAIPACRNETNKLITHNTPITSHQMPIRKSVCQTADHQSMFSNPSWYIDHTRQTVYARDPNIAIPISTFNTSVSTND